MKKSSISSVLVALAVAAALLPSCSRRGEAGGAVPLSDDEAIFIVSSDPVMYVLSVFNHEDSLVLRKPCSDFTDKDLQSDVFRTLSSHMVRTVTDSTQDGVGIAGPQVGLSRRIIAVCRLDKEGEPFEVYPNVRLDSLWGEVTHGPEGCLSVPGRRGLVPRYSNVLVSYKDPETLRIVKDTVRGFTAIIFQHETDHLDGVLYTDKADTVFVK